LIGSAGAANECERFGREGDMTNGMLRRCVHT
jgi:hypothetical protein